MNDDLEVADIVPESALAFLQAIYRSNLVPMHTRMRAASLCLPFETPKLAVTGYIKTTQDLPLSWNALSRDQTP
jgi:hypothetical protein